MGGWGNIGRSIDHEKQTYNYLRPSFYQQAQMMKAVI